MHPPLLIFLAKLGTPCAGNGFLGFPTWYEYLPGQTINGACSPVLNHLSYIWLIAAAVIEILLRVAAIVAVFFVIFGGINYVISQGEPEKVAKARGSITDALIGLALAVMAASIVAYIAGNVT